MTAASPPTAGEAAILDLLAEASRAGEVWHTARAVAEALEGRLGRSRTYEALDALAKSGLVTPKRGWRADGIALTEAGRREAAALAAANAVRRGASPSPSMGEGRGEGDAATVPAPAADTLPLSAIVRGDNPRRQFDAATIDELADSIARVGVLQNLIVRPLPVNLAEIIKGPGPIYELVAGERRWRALKALEKAGTVPADHPVPVRIVEITDEQALMLAIAENAQREDVHPLDEAEAFLALYRRTEAEGGDAAHVADRIAAETGKTRRWVEKRLALARKLSEPAREAFRAGTISLAQAQAISIAGERVQARAIGEIATGSGRWQTAAEIRETIHSQAVPCEHAFGWSATVWPGAILEIDGKPHFDDRELFLKIQKEAIEEHASRLRGKRAWIEIASHFPRWKYDVAEAGVPDAETGCILIPATRYDTRTYVHDRLVACRRDPVTALSVINEPRWRHDHIDRVCELKTTALQRAVASRPALALAVLATALYATGAPDGLALPCEGLRLGEAEGPMAATARQVLYALFGGILHYSRADHEERQPDGGLPDEMYPRLREEVEIAAISAATARFEELGEDALRLLAPLALAGAMMIAPPARHCPPIVRHLVELCDWPAADRDALLADYGELASGELKRALARGCGVPESEIARLESAIANDMSLATTGYADWLRQHATRPIVIPELAWREPAATEDSEDAAAEVEETAP